MSVLIQINDPDEMQVVVRISGSYSPDVLDDMKRRVLDVYTEALKTRIDAYDLLASQETEQEK